MSGIAVIFHRNGAPLPTDEIVELTEHIAHRGPDGMGCWAHESVGLGHCALHTLPQDIGKAQPFHNSAALFHLTFDGRIDNRDELETSLRLQQGLADGEIVLAAYERWGEECPERLLGDFAFALWDESRQQLFCARDCFGVRPFFYHVSDGVFIGASEKGPILSRPEVTNAANEAFVACFLALRMSSQTETLFRDVQRLPPATTLTITRNTIRQRSYWNIHAIKEIRYATESQYAEHLWSLLVEATKCRMRANGRAGIMLSGGVDSTAVAVAAVHSRFEPQSRLKPVPTFSLIFPGWEEADETEYIKETAQCLNLDATLCLTGPYHAGGYEDTVRTYGDLPEYFNDVFINPIRLAAKKAGISVLLSGVGGDEWFAGSDLQQFDSLRKGRFWTVWQQSRKNSAANGRPLASYLWRNVGRPCIPAWAARLRRKIVKASSGLPDWIDPSFAKRTDLWQRLNGTRISSRQVAAHHSSLLHYESGDQAFLLESHDRLNARFHLEVRHPFNDRRLVQFALGIPDEIRMFDGVTKRVVRNACGCRMPPAVRRRTDKAAFFRQLAVEFAANTTPQFFDTIRLAERGWVVPARVQEMHRIFVAVGQPERYSHFTALWHIYGLELLARLQGIS